MLERLRALQMEGLNGHQLLERWHDLMEPTGVVPDSREKFFTEVVKRANSVSCLNLFFRGSPLSTSAGENGKKR